MKPDYKLNTYFRLMVDIGLKFQKSLPMTLEELGLVLLLEAEIAKVCFKSVTNILFFISLPILVIYEICFEDISSDPENKSRKN